MYKDIRFWRINKMLFLSFFLLLSCSKDVRIGRKTDELFLDMRVSKQIMTLKGYHWDELCDCYFRLNEISINNNEYIENSMLYVKNDRVTSLMVTISGNKRLDSEVQNWIFNNFYMQSIKEIEMDTVGHYDYILIW